MSDRMVRAILGLSLCIAFIAAGVGVLFQPHIGTILLIEQAGISSDIVAWAFIVSGVFNGLDGLFNRPLNPMWFAVFVLYTGFSWVAVAKNGDIPILASSFYSLLCVFYIVNFVLEVWGERP